MRPWAGEVCKHLHPWKPWEEHFLLRPWIFPGCVEGGGGVHRIFGGIFRKKSPENGLFGYRVGMARCLQLKWWISSGGWGG